MFQNISKGISGFSLPQESLGRFDPKIFRQLCYSLARENQGTILSLDTSLVDKNFYVAQIQTYHFCIYLLRNAYYPYLAFADSVKDGMISFINQPKDFYFAWEGYHLLDTETLNVACERVGTCLNEAEQMQIKFWKPNTVGEIIFNFWD